MPEQRKVFIAEIDAAAFLVIGDIVEWPCRQDMIETRNIDECDIFGIEPDAGNFILAADSNILERAGNLDDNVIFIQQVEGAEEKKFRTVEISRDAHLLLVKIGNNSSMDNRSAYDHGQHHDQCSDECPGRGHNVIGQTPASKDQPVQ